MNNKKGAARLKTDKKEKDLGGRKGKIYENIRRIAAIELSRNTNLSKKLNPFNYLFFPALNKKSFSFWVKLS